MLYSSGMIASEGLMGIVLALFAVFGVNISLDGKLGNWGGMIFFAALVAIMIKFMFGKAKDRK